MQRFAAHGWRKYVYIHKSAQISIRFSGSVFSHRKNVLPDISNLQFPKSPLSLVTLGLDRGLREARRRLYSRVVVFGFLEQLHERIQRDGDQIITRLFVLLTKLKINLSTILTHKVKDVARNSKA
jgi:hypothetical protein